MNRSIALLAAAMPVALAIGLATVAAGPAPAAQAVDTCHNPGEWYDLPTTVNGFNAGQYWNATGTATDDLVNNQFVVFDMTVDPTTWCEVSSGSYVLYREKGTSECATYAGPAAGTAAGVGEVILKPCDSGRLAQNFLVISNGGGYSMNTEYQINNNDLNTCLSAAKWDAGDPATTPLVMVAPCSGVGGQVWYYTGPSTPGF